MSLAQEESVFLPCKSQMGRNNGIRKDGLGEFWKQQIPIVLLLRPLLTSVGLLNSFKGSRIYRQICKMKDNNER
jgi:hypothetical protein